MPAAAITCRELVELVTERFEGALPAADRDRFDAHLAECDGCTVYVEQVRTTITAVGSLPADGLSPQARERLLAAFRTFAATRDG